MVLVAGLDGRPTEDQHPEVLGHVPELADFLLLRLSEPLFVSEARVGRVDGLEVVPFEEVVGEVLDIRLLVFQVHRVRSLNLVHQLD